MRSSEIELGLSEIRLGFRARFHERLSQEFEQRARNSARSERDSNNNEFNMKEIETNKEHEKMMKKSIPKDR